MSSWIRVLAIGIAFGIIGVPNHSQAMSRNVKSVFVAGAYGALGGTVLGLAAYPATQEARSIFMGTSIGLYLGIAVGIYFIANRNSPDNPLVSEWQFTEKPLVYVEWPIKRF